MKKLFFIAIVILGFSAVSFGQTASATATGTVTAATGITKTNDLNFASVSTGAAGTIALNAATGVRTASAGLIVSGTPAFATFALVGGATQSFNFTIPNATLAADGPAGSSPMTITGWNSVPASVAGAGNGVLVSGNGTITVGATLNVGLNQMPGTYTSLPFDVTVQYQ